MFELIKAIILGVIEGVTEWLPISSTGHMILAERFLKFDLSYEFMEVFRVVIQFGAVLAVVVLYFNRLFPFSAKNGVITPDRNALDMWLKIFAACVPAAVVGILFDDLIDKTFYNDITVASALIVFGVLFILAERKNKGAPPKIDRISDITYPAAMIIGGFQLIAAIFPGTSRSGATILGGIMIGMSRIVAAEFTFFLAVPVMFGASLLKLVKFGVHFSPVEVAVLLFGLVTAFFTSLLAIKFLLEYIKKHNFKAFGWYRILLGGVVLLSFFISTMFH